MVVYSVINGVKVMARYYWDEFSFRRDLNQILHLMEKEKDPQEKIRLEACYDGLNNLLYSSFLMPDVTTPLSKRIHGLYYDFLNEQRYFGLIDVYMGILEKHLKLYNEAQTNFEELVTDIRKTGAKVGREQAVSLCYEFYKDLDDELFSHFEPFYKKRYSQLTFLEEAQQSGTSLNEGNQFYVYGLNKSYVNVLGTNTPRMPLLLIHETGHVIDSSYNPEASREPSKFEEVSSIFMELVACYKKLGNFGGNYYNKHIMGKISSIFGDAISVDDVYRILGYYKENHYKADEDFYKLAMEDGYTKREIRSTMCTENMRNIVYPIAFPLSIYFFSIYKHNNKEGLKELKKFLSTTDRDTYIPLLMSDHLRDVVDTELVDMMNTANDSFKEELGRRL